MSKAILILEMPETCAKCPLKERDRLPSGCVFRRWYSLSVNDTPITNDCCPLKPMPEYEEIKNTHPTNKYTYYQVGYNACIDEILGEEE